MHAPSRYKVGGSSFLGCALTIFEDSQGEVGRTGRSHSEPTNGKKAWSWLFEQCILLPDNRGRTFPATRDRPSPGALLQDVQAKPGPRGTNER